jgi:hypothetical protein
MRGSIDSDTFASNTQTEPRNGLAREPGALLLQNARQQKEQSTAAVLLRRRTRSESSHPRPSGHAQVRGVAPAASVPRAFRAARACAELGAGRTARRLCVFDHGSACRAGLTCGTFLGLVRCNAQNPIGGAGDVPKGVVHGPGDLSVQSVTGRRFEAAIPCERVVDAGRERSSRL